MWSMELISLEGEAMGLMFIPHKLRPMDMGKMKVDKNIVTVFLLIPLIMNTCSMVLDLVGVVVVLNLAIEIVMGEVMTSLVV